MYYIGHSVNSIIYASAGALHKSIQQVKHFMTDFQQLFVLLSYALKIISLLGQKALYTHIIMFFFYFVSLSNSAGIQTFR